MGVRIPKKVIDATNMKLNQELAINIINDSIVLTPIKKDETFTLEEMLKGVTPKDVQGEVDWGDDVGAEIIDD